MSRRDATPEELREAVDVVLPAHAFTQAIEDRRAERQREQRQGKWKRLGFAAAMATQFGLNAALLAFVFVRPPQETQVPIVVYQRPDGTVTNYTRWEELPERVRHDSVVNIAWTYVQEREGWYAPRASYSHRVVSALSAKPVREQFQAWYDPNNAESPARRYRDGTAVQIEWINWGTVCPDGGCQGDPDTYRIEYRRIETPPGGTPIDRGTFTADVTVRRNVPMAEEHRWLRWTVNPAQVLVVGYPGPRVKGMPQ